MSLSMIVLRHRRTLPLGMLLVFLVACYQVFFPHPSRKVRIRTKDIDVVYTWVNGTDPTFQASLQQFFHHEQPHLTEIKGNRFQDNDQLRSLEVYAPWIRNVYVVTNGQVPYWLNTTYDRVQVINHSDIFIRHEQLPTFSSSAIEVHLHRIQGLSEEFLYLNDDFFLGASITLDDFYTDRKGYKVYLGGEIPPQSDMMNGEAYVGDDQSRKKIMSTLELPEDTYAGSLRFVAHLFQVFYDVTITRQIAHLPHLINKALMAELQARLTPFYEATSSHRFRRADDMQFALSYFSYLMHGAAERYEITATDDVSLVPIANDVTATRKALHGARRSKFICLNDEVDYKNKNIDDMLTVMTTYLRSLYPHPSSFEKILQ